MLYVRSKAEAMEALASVLALAERQQQIVQITVRVATCLDSEARSFLADCQAGLIGGGLEQMRRQRQEMLEAAQADKEEPIVIVDSAEDQLLEEVGAALDVLRVAEIAREVFDEARDRLPAWLVGRAIFANEAEMRNILRDAIRFRKEPEASKRYLDMILLGVDSARPSWMDAVPTLTEACREAIQAQPSLQKGPQDDVELLFSTVAVSEVRTNTLFDLLAKNRGDALEYLGEIRKRIALLHELEERSAK